MCLPKPPKPQAPAATAVPSIASAEALQLGGSSTPNNPRGAAQLGRLLLRFNGTSGQAAPAANAPSQAPDAAGPTSTAYSAPNVPYSYAGFGSSFAFKQFGETADAL